MCGGSQREKLDICLFFGRDKKCQTVLLVSLWHFFLCVFFPQSVLFSLKDLLVHYNPLPKC